MKFDAEKHEFGMAYIVYPIPYNAQIVYPEKVGMTDGFYWADFGPRGERYQFIDMTRSPEHDYIKADVLNKVGIAGNHLGLLLGDNHPPHTDDFDVGMFFYGPGKNYEIWTAWKLCYEAYETMKRRSVPPTDAQEEMK